MFNNIPIPRKFTSNFIQCFTFFRPISITWSAIFPSFPWHNFFSAVTKYLKLNYRTSFSYAFFLTYLQKLLDAWRLVQATVLLIGLGVKLVHETLAKAGTPYVEMPAVMAKYNPFAEKAGMQKIADQPPPKEALKIAEILHQLGFNIQLLGSEKYVLNKLQALSGEELAKVREAFIKHNHGRFMKYFFPHQLFGKKEVYVKEIMKASLERLAHLIKVCGFLLQTKVYLFWQNRLSL